MILTLPSNASMTHHPDNKAGHFYVKLPQTITLSQDYEVGLAEIQFANAYVNVTADDVWLVVTLFAGVEKTQELGAPELEANAARPSDKFITHRHKLALPTGRYDTAQSLVAALNRLTPQIHFGYDTIRNKVKIKLTDTIAVEFSEKLTNLLGLERHQMSFLTNREEESLSFVNVAEGFKSIFVYCDLVAPRPVGDTNVSLLRTLPPIEQKIGVIHHIFVKPYYIPLKYYTFDTVEILLANDRGEEMQFNGGLTIVTLHFKKRRFEDQEAIAPYV